MSERLKWIDFTWQIDDHATRMASLLNTVTLISAGTAMLSLVIVTLTNSSSPWSYVVLISVLLSCLLVQVIMRCGYAKLAGVIFQSVIFVILTVFSFYTNGLRSPSYIALMFLTLYAGFMLGRNGASLIYASLFVLTTSTLFVIEVYNLLPPPLTQNPLDYLIVHIASVVLGTTFVLYVIRNINQGVAKLQRSEEQFREIFELAPIGMATTTLEGQFLRANQALCDMLGYTREELLNIKFPEITYPDDLAENLALTQKLFHGEITNYKIEKRYLRKDGSIVTAFLQVSLIRDASGNPHQLIGQLVDLTERKQAEEALRQSQKLESLGVLAGGIAHDFNNLLTAVLAQSSLVQIKLTSDNPAHPHVAKIVNAAERAANLTQQMLAYAGQGKFQILPLDLNEIIRDNLHLLDTVVPKNVRLERRLAESLPLVRADTGQMQQVIMNLIINGAEAVENRREPINEHEQVRDDGWVIVKTDIQTINDGKQLSLPYTNKALAPGLYVSVSVIDNGVGMDKETQTKIFDPFFSTKVSGRGLGLAAVLGIVRGHNGGLQVESKVGQGTTFRILLPAHVRSSNGFVPSNAGSSANRLRGNRILVIDDEEPVRNTIIDVLHEQGAQTLVAADGAAGIDLYRQRMDDVHLIILDLSMPGLSGRDTLEQLRALNPNVPILLSSGYSESESFAHLRKNDVAGFLKKPYKWNQLIVLVQQHLP